jgi:hypothetical protein
MRSLYFGIIFSLSLIFAPAAWSSYTVVCAPAAGGMSCDDADLVCESFEGSLGPNSEYDLSGWTETTTGGTIDAGKAHSGSLSCTDKGSDAFELNYTTPASPLYASYDMGSDQDIYISFYFYLVSETIPTWSTVNIFDMRNAANGSSFIIRLWDDNGDYKFGVGWYTSPSWYYLTATDTFNISTWVFVQIEYNDTTNVVKLYLNEGTPVSRTSETAPDRKVRYFTVGNRTSIGTSTVKFELDNLKVDSTSLPGACP